MGIPMWREPSEADNLKSTLEKDSSAAARSAIRRQPTIRRPSRHSHRARGSGAMSSFHTQILDEIQRGLGEPQVAVRSPVMNLGMSEDGLDLDSSRRDALRNSTRPGAHRREHVSRRGRNTRDQAWSDLLGRSDLPTRSNARFSNSSLTPNFAPALAYHHTSHPSSDGVRLPPLPSLRRTDSRGHDPASIIPPVLLRDYRASRASDRSNRESAIDGLGDRQRSLSPDAEPTTDAWDLLLSTITPDATLPSTDTSFSSTNSATDASRNGTSRNSGASSQTTQPSPMPSRDIRIGLDPYPDHLHPCDLSSSDDEDTPVDYHRILGRSGLPLSLRRSPGLPSTMGSQPPAPTISFSFSDSNDTDLQQMQAIFDRFARRQDVPEDWWAGVGLSRTIGRGLNAGTDTPENQGS
ncbi:hypothetical protein N7492_002958 [Penicillium capsulatum]|uniref:Uncharacterized protein n=1 Tax=Penicillium capsulatum TaxID=69766 RepID=A0A9W9IKB9_9EURO|nr:hypothetical protein N7492_002958 [Penicillium capsulatum]